MFEESPFTGACTFATLEVISMLIGSILLGVLLGYLIWGWTKRRLELVERELAKVREENQDLQDKVRFKESIAIRRHAQNVAVGAHLVKARSREESLEKKLTLNAAREASIVARNTSGARATGAEVSRTSSSGLGSTSAPFPRGGALSSQQTDDQFLAEAEQNLAETVPDRESLKRASKIMGREVEFNDLTMIEGIGPRIAEVLQQSGITSWEILSKQTKHVLRVILDEAGPEFRVHKPKTWPRQARMAADGEWRKLKAYQDVLSGGV